MLKRFGDFEHLIRMAGLFALGTLGLLALRGVLVPADFGEYGHFRTGAITANASQELVYAGHEACEDCHESEAETKRGGPHRVVNCESCHGPLAAHAADPLGEAVAPPRAGRLCRDCHGQNVSRPDWFPQIDVEEHSMGESCDSCHVPHDPDFE